MFASGLWKELAPEPGRAIGTVRITAAALLVAVVMLAFRMPFLAIGPYLVFLLCQRDLMLTRAAAVLGIVVGVLACLLIYFVASVAWDVAWLRVSLLAAVFFGGYFLMRILPEPRIVLGALVVLALFSGDFDTVPDPNYLLDQLGWVWAIFGLLFAAVFLTQWLFAAPNSRELAREQMRRILTAAEARTIDAAFARTRRTSAMNELPEAAMRIKTMGALRLLQPAQAARCQALLQGCKALLETATPPSRPDHDETARLLAAAAWLRRLRHRVLRGDEVPLEVPAEFPRTPGFREAIENLAQVASDLLHPETKPMGKPPRRSSIPADASSFALRAMLATMGCYIFMALTNWDGIHTCMITCVVTAMAAADAREHKQHLRLAGAIIGGALGMGAVIFIIPTFDSLMALLLLLAAGSALAAWVALGSQRITYAGWQIALAFYITVLQAPHPSTDLDAIRDRWVGIIVGILAMRIAFWWPTPEARTLSAQEPAAHTP